MPLSFRPFLKIQRRAAGTAGGTWVATEKIHGANFVIAVSSGAVSFGKRKAWLAAQEPFFGWQLIASALGEAVRALAEALQAPQVFCYGELFGGGYPHASVAPSAGLQPVQTGVWYAPDLRWSPFDVLVAQGDEDPGMLLSFTEVEALAAQVGLQPPPVIARGRLRDLLALPVEAPTQVPAQLGLPPIAGNVAEGLVLKPDVRAAPSMRPISKRKIAAFDESRFDEALPWSPGVVSPAVLATWAARMVNPARLASARSKVGVDPERIVEEVTLDVAVDLEAAFAEGWRALRGGEPEALLAEIARCAQAALADERSTGPSAYTPLSNFK